MSPISEPSTLPSPHRWLSLRYGDNEMTHFIFFKGSLQLDQSAGANGFWPLCSHFVEVRRPWSFVAVITPVLCCPSSSPHQVMTKKDGTQNNNKHEIFVSDATDCAPQRWLGTMRVFKIIPTSLYIKYKYVSRLILGKCHPYGTARTKWKCHFYRKASLQRKIELESILGFKTLTHIISAVEDQITDGSHCKAALSGHVFILVAEEGWTQTKLPVNSSCMIWVERSYLV